MKNKWRLKTLPARLALISSSLTFLPTSLVLASEVDDLLNEADDLLSDKQPQALPKKKTTQKSTTTKNSQPSQAATPPKQKTTDQPVLSASGKKDLKQLFALDLGASQKSTLTKRPRISFFLAPTIISSGSYTLVKDDDSFATEPNKNSGVLIGASLPAFALTSEIHLQYRFEILYDQPKVNTQRRGVSDEQEAYEHERFLTNLTFGPTWQWAKNWSLFAGGGLGIDLVQQKGFGDNDTIFLTTSNINGQMVLSYSPLANWQIHSGMQTRGLAGIGIESQIFYFGLGYQLAAKSPRTFESLKTYESH